MWSGLLIDQLINLESVMESKISVALAVEEDSGDSSKCIINSAAYDPNMKSRQLVLIT